MKEKLNFVKTISIILLLLGAPAASVLGFGRYYGDLVGFDKFGAYIIFPPFVVWLAVAVSLRRYLYLYHERKPPFYKDWRFWTTVTSILIPVVFCQASNWAARSGFDVLSSCLFAVRYVAAGVVLSIAVLEIVYSQCFGTEL
jgi:hypothetical protein